MKDLKTDKVALGVLKSHFVAAAEAMGHTLERSSYSTFVKESADFATALATPRGEFFGYPRTVGVSSFLGLDLGPAIGAFTDYAPGDVVITNDPYGTQGLVTHLPDMHLFKPVFHDRTVLCFSWCFIHCSDVGGLAPASMAPSADEIYQEGFRVPPSKLCREGQLDETLLALVLGNSRSPAENLGDLRAMLGALTTGERHIAECVAKFGSVAVNDGMEDVLTWTENLTRARLATIPDGDYAFVDYLDDDGAGAPIRLAVTLRVRGEEIELDYTGSDPQVHAAYNLPAFGPRHPFLAQAIINFVLSEEPDMPLTGAIMRPLRCVAPGGSVVTPEYPAAVGVRYATVARAYDVVMGALAQAVPDRVPAAGSGAAAVVMVSVPDLEGGGRQVAALEPLQGGGGATAGADGVDGTDSMAGFLRNTPIESVEANLPVLIERYELIADSAGPGRHRGGWGTRLDFRILRPDSIVTAQGMERCRFEPWGLAGGGAAGRWTALTNPGASRERVIGQIDVLRCDPGDVISVLTCGGGGYGDPILRDAGQVVADCRAGLLSFQTALTVYGVVVDEAGFDEAATAEARLDRGAGRACDAPLFSFGPARTEYEQLWTDELSTGLASLLYTLPTGLRPFAKRELRLLIERDGTPATPIHLRSMWNELASFHLLSNVGDRGSV
jgi:N-methylhydantoinase B